MKIAIAQVGPTVGDIGGNAEAIRGQIAAAKAGGAGLVVFPELALIGYPPKDLLLKPAVVERCDAALGEIAKSCAGITALVGYPQRSDQGPQGLLYNAVGVCRDGAVVGSIAKTLLPTYDVFDERRYFRPGAEQPLPQISGVPIGVSICEDLWNDEQLIGWRRYQHDPIGRLAGQGAKLLVNCAASPFTLGKHAFRLRLLRSAARRYAVPIVFCNQVGGNDELVFDGNSCVVDAHGRLIAAAKDFETDLVLVDVPTHWGDPGDAEGKSPELGGGGGCASEGVESIYRALVLGLRDYARKCGFTQIVLGLSGGIDSAVCAAIAVAAVGSENVLGVAMPSRYSSEGSIGDAKELAHRLKIAFRLIPIDDVHGAYERMLEPHFEGRPPDTTEENLQARIRGAILMSLSNKFGSLLITTGNKSELAVGYCTLYGDMCGGLAVISDVPKTVVWELARWINNAPESALRQRFGGAVIPETTINKVPSAELRPEQTDQDSLPEYALLDQIVERYVEHDRSVDQIIAEVDGADPETIKRVVRMIDTNEYKREQMPPGLKVTGRAFGFGRRMPIAQGYRP